MKCNCFVVYEIDAVSRDQGSSCDLLLKILCQVDSHGYVIYTCSIEKKDRNSQKRRWERRRGREEGRGGKRRSKG